MKNSIIRIIIFFFIISVIFSISINNLPQENVGFTDAEGRKNFMKDRRNGGVNNNAIKAAEKIVSNQIKQLKDESRDGDIEGWEELGPYNMGGRIRAIAINPDDGDDIFIGAAAGGIWRSTDGGTNWFLVTPYNDSHPIMDIQYHPTNSNTMLAVTGEYRGGGPELTGIGVLRSTNGGTSWTQMNQPSNADFTYLSKVRYDQNNPTNVFVSGSKKDNYGNNDIGVIYKSTNAGLDWTELWTESDISGNIYDLEIDPNNSSKLFFGNGKSIYYSTNGGAAWTEATFSDDPAIQLDFIGRHEVQICPNNSSIVWGLRYQVNTAGNSNVYKSKILRSSNGGTSYSEDGSTSSTFNDLNILGSQGNYDNVLWVNPINCNKIIMGGLDVWKYSMGDANPVKISDWRDDIDGNNANGDDNSIHADHHVIVEHPDFNDINNEIVFFGNDGGIYNTNDINSVTENNGWSSLIADLNISQFYGADVSYDGNTLVGGTQDNGYMFDINSNNGLGTFDVYSTGDGGYCRVDKGNSNIFYTTTQKGNLYKTTNGGSSFCHIWSFTNTVPFTCCNCSTMSFDIQDSEFISPMIMNPNNSNHILIGGQTLYETKNGGTTWNDITNFSQGANQPEISALDISASNSDLIYLGSDSGSLVYTNNGGGTFNDWTILDNSSLGLPNKYITDIAINALDESKVMVTFGGYDQDHTYLTEDGGATWTNRSLNFDMQVNTVTWHPSLNDIVYIGTDIGIFASEDNGQTWSVIPHLSNSEGPVFTRVEELFWQGDGSAANLHFLMAATHGRGIWRTNQPLRSKIYVDKNCFFCGELNQGAPYQFFENALAVALPGAEIIFQSSGDHNEAPPSIIVDKNIIINKEGSGSAIIK